MTVSASEIANAAFKEIWQQTVVEKVRRRALTLCAGLTLACKDTRLERRGMVCCMSRILESTWFKPQDRAIANFMLTSSTTFWFTNLIRRDGTIKPCPHLSWLVVAAAFAGAVHRTKDLQCPGRIILIFSGMAWEVENDSLEECWFKQPNLGRKIGESQSSFGHVFLLTAVDHFRLSHWDADD